MFILYNFQLNQQTDKAGTTEDLSFLKGASPIYVTSLTDNNVTPIGVNLNINNTQSFNESNNNTSLIPKASTNIISENQIAEIINESSAKTQSNKITSLTETKLKSNLNGNLSTGDLVNDIKSKKEVDNYFY